MARGGGGGYPAAPFPQTPIPSISNTITLTVMVQKVRSSPPPLQGQPLSGWAEAPNPPTQIRGEHPRPPGRLNSGAFRASNLKHSVRSVVSANRAGSGSERPFSPCQWHPPLPKTQRFFFSEHLSGVKFTIPLQFGEGFSTVPVVYFSKKTLIRLHRGSIPDNAFGVRARPSRVE